MSDSSNSNANSNNSNVDVALGSKNDTIHNDQKKDSADANALSNAGKATSAYKETATLVLRGYPLLKAKTTVEITGVGKGSGIWYCKTVVQQWHVDHGYLTNAQLTKGSGGDSSGGPGGDDDIPEP